jgi:hypothetical protein
VLWFWVFVVSGYPARRVRTRFPLIENGFSRIEERRRGRKIFAHGVLLGVLLGDAEKAPIKTGKE